MVRSFFIERTKRSARLRSRCAGIRDAARRRARRSFFQRSLRRSNAAIPPRSLPDFIPTKLTGFSPLKQATGGFARRALRGRAMPIACFALLVCAALLQQRRRRRRRHSLSYLCQVSCCNSRRSTGIQRGEHGQLIPAATLSSRLVGHRRRASAHYTCMHVSAPGCVRVCERTAKTPDYVTEKFRRAGARTNVEIARA